VSALLSAQCVERKLRSVSKAPYSTMSVVSQNSFIEIQWIGWKFTGKPHDQKWEKLWFPVKFFP
jgi:hypothetical protein